MLRAGQRLGVVHRTVAVPPVLIHLVVDRGPFRLGQRRVHGEGEAHARVGVHGECAAFGRPQTGPLRDAGTHRGVGVGGQQGHGLRRRAVVAGDQPGVLGQRLRHDIRSERPVEQQMGTRMAVVCGKVLPYRVGIEEPFVQMPARVGAAADLRIGVCQQGVPYVGCQGLPGEAADPHAADLGRGMSGHRPLETGRDQPVELPQVVVLVRLDDPHDGPVRQRPGQADVVGPGLPGQMPPHAVLRIVHQPCPLLRIGVRVLCEEGTRPRVRVGHHRIHHGTGQHPVPAQHLPSLVRPVREQPQQDVDGRGRIERHTDRPECGRNAGSGYLLMRHGGMVARPRGLPASRRSGLLPSWPPGRERAACPRRVRLALSVASTPTVMGWPEEPAR